MNLAKLTPKQKQAVEAAEPFLEMAQELVERKGISRSEALLLVKKEYPEARAALIEYSKAKYPKPPR